MHDNIPGPAPADAPPFFIIPADLDFRLAPGEPATSERAWMFMLQQWHLGQDPSLRSLRSAFGWSWERLIREYVACRDWAVAVNNNMPDAVRVRVPGQQRDPVDNESGTLFEMPGPLTHADVVQRAVRWLRGHHKCNPVYAEIVTYERVNPDAIGFRKAAGSTRAWSVLVEAKISRADFRADQDKIIHRLPDSCPGQERWYLTPPNLLRASEIPDGWGLAECGARSVRIVKAAPHGDPIPERMHADMGILVAAARRHRIGVKWNDDTAKFAPYSSATEDE